MKRNWLLAICLALVLTMVFLCGCGQSSTTSSQQEGIWVTGEGKVFATPDIVELRLGIEAQEESVAQAQTEAVEAMNRVMAALTENGVDEDDIQTQYFSIRQITKWDRDTEEEAVTGYRVSNMVTAKIRDVDKAGTIIDAVAQAGGDSTRIDNINFSIDDPSVYYEQARPEAMAEAKAKAEHLAQLGGVSLGKPTYISEGVQAPPISPRSAIWVEEAVKEPTPISPGEIEVTVTVQVVYSIQ